MKKQAVIVALSALIAVMAVSASHAGQDKDVLYQVSTIGSLLEGGYDGVEPYSEVMSHGGFGIGTFDTLDGEMVALDGSFYQIKADGKPYEVDAATTTPFAVVTYFEPDRVVEVTGPMDLKALKEFIDSIFPGDGLAYAIKLHGRFASVKTRSVRAQSKPYPRLVDAVKDQPVFELKAVYGTLVGFRLPAFLGAGLNVPGYHFHFITDDRTAGGHVLDCGLESGRLEADETPALLVEMYDNAVTPGSARSGDGVGELEKVEGR